MKLPTGTFIRDFGKPALFYNGRPVPFREVMASASCYAKACGATAGDHVAVYAENRPEWVFAFYSAWLKGAIPVPIDVFSTVDDLAYILADAAPATLFTSREKEPVAREAILRASASTRLLVVEDLVCEPGEPVPAFPDPDPASLALILYTSGTTGNPKGVMLSFGNLRANVEAVTRGVPIFTPQDRLFAFLPFHHILPLLGNLVVPLSIGGSTAIASSLKPDDLAACMQAHQVTIIIGVPRFWALLRKGIRDKIQAAGPLPRLLFRLAAEVRSVRLSRLLFKKVHARFGGKVKYLISGGAPLDVEVLRDFQTLGFELLEGYGMTEAAPMITFPRPGQVRNGACGQALPGEEIRIVDGEVTVRGPNIMMGYYHKPDETAEALQDGWLHTGDLGTLDRDGFLFITGRSKELLVLPNGKKISPFEIEARLAAMAPDLKEVAVLMKEGGLHALVVPDVDRYRLKGAVRLEETIRWDLIDKYNRLAPPYKRITSFSILKEELPKTRLGKLRRHLLDGLATRNPEEESTEPEPAGDTYRLLRDFLKSEVERTVRPGSHLEIDLGLDSLGKISLQVFLESTFGVPVDETILAGHGTVAELASFIDTHKTRTENEAANWSHLLRDEPPARLPPPGPLLTVVHAIGRIGFRAWFSLKGSGQDQLPAPPFILAPNHQSYLDAFFVCLFLKPDQLRQTWFYAKEKHLRNPWLRRLATRHNVIVVDIDRDLKQSLQQMAGVLKSGHNLLIFPEGTRSRDGLPGNFKRTFAILSKELNVPVVPVSISGAFAALPPGGRIPRPFTRVAIRFLPAVHPDSLAVEDIRDRVRDSIFSRMD
jgi:long-chain acyl-CoA synthetase